MGKRRCPRGYRIQTAAPEWMTAQDAPDRQTDAAHRTVGLDRHGGVLRTGWNEAAAAWTKRVQRRGEPALVKTENCKQYAGHTFRRGAATSQVRAASALACIRIRTTSMSSFVNSALSTVRRG